MGKLWLEGVSRDQFVEKYEEDVIKWVLARRKEIIANYKDYSYHGKSFDQAKNERDEIEESIKECRKTNNGGLDLPTADEVCLWGFNKVFPIRDEEKVIAVTRRAFRAIDVDDLFLGIKFLLANLKGIGISLGSKIIALSDQNRLAIYDSRVGNALKELTYRGDKIIPCPPGRVQRRECDKTTPDGWARGYERLIWTLEIMRDYLNEIENTKFRVADIEMALFMIGK